MSTTPTTNTISTCLCNSITLTLPQPPSSYENYLCFCDHCAKNASSTHQISITIPSTELTVSDPKNLLKEYIFDSESTDSDLPKRKYFCGRCGVHMYNVLDADNGMVVVKGGAVVERYVLAHFYMDIIS